jgi:hypothetical protein
LATRSSPVAIVLYRPRITKSGHEPELFGKAQEELHNQLLAAGIPLGNDLSADDHQVTG